MSIESRIQNQDLNIKDLNLESPELEGEVYFDEAKILSPVVWKEMTDFLREDLKRRLEEPDPDKRDNELASYAGGPLLEMYVLAPEKSDDLPTVEAVGAAYNSRLQQHLDEGKFNLTQDDLLYYLMAEPQGFNNIQLTEEQLQSLFTYIEEARKNADKDNAWESYLAGLLILKHLYPNDRSKWIEMQPETMEEFKKQYAKAEVDEKLAYKMLAPEIAVELPFPKEEKTKIYKELLEARQKKEWKDYREKAIQLKVADAQEITYTQNGMEIKLKPHDLASRTSAIPEVKKF